MRNYSTRSVMTTHFMTVGDAISRILPKGTNPSTVDDLILELIGGNGTAQDDHARWLAPPLLPPDMFAASGFLCKVGGIIPFFDPSPFSENLPGCQFTLSRKVRKLADKAAKTWQKCEKGLPPESVNAAWNILIAAWDKSIYAATYDDQNQSAPEWWCAAMYLVLVSDMVCDRILRDPLPNVPVSKFEKKSQIAVQRQGRG